MRKSILSKVTDFVHDRKFQIKTRGITKTYVNDDANHSATAPYRVINRLIHHLDLTHTDTFVDVGCGKGRVLACVAQHKINRVIGIEASPTEAAVARANMEALNRRMSEVVVETAKAEEYDYHKCTIAYFFNPFGPATIARVLDKIRKDKKETPFRACYFNPNKEQVAVFREKDWKIYQKGRLNRMPYLMARINWG